MTIKWISKRQFLRSDITRIINSDLIITMWESFQTIFSRLLLPPPTSQFASFLAASCSMTALTKTALFDRWCREYNTSCKDWMRRIIIVCQRLAASVIVNAINVNWWYSYKNEQEGWGQKEEMFIRRHVWRGETGVFGMLLKVGICIRRWGKVYMHRGWGV